MSTLVKDVLKYSEISYAEDFFTPIDLNGVLENVKEDFELLIEETNTRIHSSILPAIEGIPIQLHQLFSNLISNSIKFRNENPLIEISCQIAQPREIECFPLDKNKEYLKIVMKDNGIGFEQQYADQVFKLFQRLHNTQNGSGIGLALCKKIVENHKGHITVSSLPNKGTTFTIFLPK